MIDADDTTAPTAAQTSEPANTARLPGRRRKIANGQAADATPAMPVGTARVASSGDGAGVEPTMAASVAIVI
ncbi:MAG: hypothetical protein KJO76_09885 [Gammaproteobacteria bacterium]|nr:hypothetical protein [Gammaproteobacteria bacterium]MBT8443481.1 hypothetical protein [Gammaproteobacteria bacterium]